jgi:hypothetical protein
MYKSLSEVNFGEGGRDEQRESARPEPGMNGMDRARPEK